MSCSFENESDIFHFLMDEISILSVSTVCHVPRNVRSLLAQVLSTELSYTCEDGVWGFARFPSLPSLFCALHFLEVERNVTL